MERHIFTEVDDCILAAYRHVKTTGTKIEPFDEWNEVGQVSVGLQSDDDHIFFMSMSDHLVSDKRILARKIVKLGISVVDFVNRQLIVWL